MAQQAFYTKINASAGVQFSGGTIAQATGVLHTNNVLYLRGGSSGLFLQNADGS
jgi:acyl-CoA synthetase (AMP-forming)/AMP-acid ligase II